MQGLRPLFLLRLRLAPKQASAEEETAFVPQACITARKTLKQADAVKVTPNPNF